MANKYDVLVIGGGPGGYVAAIRAAQLGMKVALVEKEHLGGICLNWGCIPTKALLKTSEINHLLQNLDEYGFSAENIKFDFNKIIDRSRKVSSQLSSGINHLLKKNKVDIILGKAKLLTNNSVDVEGKTITSNNIIIATGARAREIPNFESDGKLIWSYKDALKPKEMPKKLLVVGSGAIGIEFASFYRNMGAEVTLIEMMEQILPVEDKEISDFARKSFEKQGMKIFTNSNIQKFVKKENEVEVTFKHKNIEKSVTVDKVIMAVGIVGNVEDLGLEKLNVEVQKNHIVTNEWCETSAKNIYAIGDIAGAPWLAHKASHEAMICIEKIAGSKHVSPLNKKNIPGCTYCYPQIASVGLTEKDAKSNGYDIKIGRFPYIGNGKAIAIGKAEGLIKTIFDSKTGELLGAHMVGAEVTEMIQGFVIGKTMEATEEDFMHTVFAHPTLSEMMHESVLDAYKRAIHI